MKRRTLLAGAATLVLAITATTAFAGHITSRRQELHRLSRHERAATIIEDQGGQLAARFPLFGRSRCEVHFSGGDITRDRRSGSPAAACQRRR